MTIRVAEDHLVLGEDGAAYKVGPWCANPTCKRTVDHVHHIFTKAQMGGDYSWVRIDDDYVVGNLTGLCAWCHTDIHGDVGGTNAAIRFVDNEFLWCSVRNRWGEIELIPQGLLRPQPPTPESLTGSAPATASESESEQCPTCGHTKRRGPAGPPGPRRPKKTWTVKVPDDQENGAEVLNTMVDDLAVTLGFDDPKSALRRYHVLVPALYWAQQNKRQFIEEIKEAVG